VPGKASESLGAFSLPGKPVNVKWKKTAEEGRNHPVERKQRGTEAGVLQVCTGNGDTNWGDGRKNRKKKPRGPGWVRSKRQSSHQREAGTKQTGHDVLECNQKRRKSNQL